jgi:RNA polymerase sigma factor for flagellar operon FliA
MTTIEASPPRTSTNEGTQDGPMGAGFLLRELWRRYGEGDDAAHEQLVLNYAPLVKVVAGRVGSRLPSHVDQADLISFGLSGLMGAIERYEPERGFKFETFAIVRIRGAMIDALRSLDWVPRRVRENAREFERVESKLGARLGRAPSEAELADGLGIGLESLRKSLLEIADSRIYSFEAPLPGRGEEGVQGETSLLDLVSSSDLTDPQQALDDSRGAGGALTEAIEGLPEREQFVLACRYRDDLRLGEIGEVLGISESRASQIHTKALIGLRAALGVAAGGEPRRPGHSWN